MSYWLALGLSGMLWVIAWCGFWFNRRNMITLLMCVELMFLAAGTNFVVFSHHYQHLDGQVMVCFMMALAACESVVALAMVVLLYRQHQSLVLSKLRRLQG